MFIVEFGPLGLNFYRDSRRQSPWMCCGLRQAESTDIPQLTDIGFV